MLKVTSLVVLGWCGLLSHAAGAGPADPVATVKEFSDFHAIDPARLLAGEILSERGDLMNFPNGISAQTCFVVPLSAEETAKRLQTWNPSAHDSLKVFAYHFLGTPCQPADFKPLSFQSSQRPVRWLLEKTTATTATKSDLNFTRAEAQALAAGLRRGSNPPNVAECWAQLLFDRAVAFQQQGLAGVPAYEVGAEPVSPAAQLHTMLFEQPPVAHEFTPMLKQLGLLGHPPATNAAPVYYWSLFDADRHGTLNLGAFYRLAVQDHYQLADVEYYVSGNYYTAAALYEVWPIRVGDQSAALVWREDFFAAPMLAFTKGTERIAYGALMLQEIKKEIRFFLDDQKGKR